MYKLNVNCRRLLSSLGKQHTLALSADDIKPDAFLEVGILEHFTCFVGGGNGFIADTGDDVAGLDADAGRDTPAANFLDQSPGCVGR